MLRCRTRQLSTEQVPARCGNRTTLPGDLGWRRGPRKSAQHVQPEAVAHCIDMQCEFTMRVSARF
jgi:hypothetical protein